MTDLTAMRATYETWATEWHGRDFILKNTSGSYCVASVEHDWRVWQAAWNAKPAAQVSEAVAWMPQFFKGDRVEVVNPHGHIYKATITKSETRWCAKHRPYIFYTVQADGETAKSIIVASAIHTKPVAAHPATEQADVPTWQERVKRELPELDFKWLQPAYQIKEMQAEIADLRAALAQKG
jgi:hypothetical protein